MSLNRYPSRLTLVAGAALGLLNPPARAGTLRSVQGYTVTIPQGWQTWHETHPGANGYSTDMTFASPPHGFPVFRVEVDPQRGATMAKARAGLEEFVRTRLPDFRVAAQRQCRVAGSPASEMGAGGHIQGQPMLIDMVFTIHDGKDYTITLIMTTKNVKPDVETFERILGTFRWTKSG